MRGGIPADNWANSWASCLSFARSRALEPYSTGASSGLLICFCPSLRPGGLGWTCIPRVALMTQKASKMISETKMRMRPPRRLASRCPDSIPAQPAQPKRDGGGKPSAVSVLERLLEGDLKTEFDYARGAQSENSGANTYAVDARVTVRSIDRA